MDRYYVDAQRGTCIPDTGSPGGNPNLRNTDVEAWAVVDRSRNRVVAVCPGLDEAYRIGELLNDFGGLS